MIDSLAQGGAERSLLDLAGEMPKHGVRTSIATLRDEPDGFSADDQGIERIRLRGTTPLGRVANLHSHLRAGGFDLVHTTLLASDLTGRVAAWGTGVPVLSSVVNTTYDPDRLSDPNVASWKVNLIRHVDGWTARNLTDRLHAVTKEVGNSAHRTLGVPESRIVVIMRGRDPAEFSPSFDARDETRRSVGLASNAPVFLTVGRHEYQKGHAALIEAWPAVLATAPNAVLLLAGRAGHESPRLADMVDRLAISESVRFLGFRRDVGDLLAAADVFVFPSRYEGLGGAMLEAMAAHVPIVVSDLPVTREVLGDDAWFFPAGDAARLADAMIAALGRADDSVPDAALNRFMAHFTLEAVGAQMAELYREVVEAASPRDGNRSR